MFFYDKYDGRYLLNKDISNENGLVLFDTKTSTALMVYRGANSGQDTAVLDEYTLTPIISGHDELGRPLYAMKPSEQGKLTNALDYENSMHVMTRGVVTRGKISSNDLTLEKYPELNQQGEAAIATYGRSNVESVAYSNGGSKAHYLRVNKGIKMTAFDPIISASNSSEAIRLGKSLPEAHYVRTNQLSLGMDGM